MSITDHLIDFCNAPAPDDARNMMRLSMFDWAACGIAGVEDAGFADFKDIMLSQTGPGEATMLGGGQNCAASAALFNGTVSHALDFDDTHFAHIGHPSVAVVPAVLAIVEREGLDFEAALDAALIGVEASIHVGLWLGRSHYQIGFHQTATAGAFGATLAAARLLHLADDQIRHALGLCASLASGVKAQFGTGGKPLNAGLAARSGVEAALWAQGGLTACADGLAAPLGFGATHHGAQDETYLPSMGQSPWQILKISHKFHACCHGLHAMLEALAATQMDATEIDKIVVHTHPRWMSVCNKPDPETGLAAKFSYRHTAAMALLGKSTAQRAMFSDAVACDPDVVALRQKVVVSESSDLSEMQANVQVVLLSGEMIDLTHDLSVRLPHAVLTEKLRNKVENLLGGESEERLWQAVNAGDLPSFLATLGESNRR
ncbi:MAG: MmgE/PrpD family protein [Paracoccaceae bacterium]|nr:MmgE/PrpD family protein [Paracoccaceae bacterium]